LAKLASRRYTKYLIPVKYVGLAEKDWIEKERITKRYAHKWRAHIHTADIGIENILECAPAYREITDKDALRTDMRFCRLAYGFSPLEYMTYGLEHRKGVSERRAFFSDWSDKGILYHKLNRQSDVKILNNKYTTYDKFKEYYKRDAIAISRPEHFGRFRDFVRKHPVFVKKPLSLGGGRGIELVDLSASGKSEREYFAGLMALQAYILEECIIQSEDLSIFNPSSLTTVRCITFYTKNGVVAPPYLSFFRTGRRGSFVDNASKGGIACGIDSVSGRLATDAYAQYYGERYACHPDSGIQFKGYQLPEWEKLLGMCKEMSAQLPSVKFISWDMAHADKDGWVVVEGNSHGAIDFQQLFWNRGLKADIEEIVRNTETIM